MDQRAINVLRRVAAREEGHVVELKKTRTHQLLSKDRANMVERIKEIGRSADLATIVAAERFLVKNDLDRYANSADMKSSLTAALMEIDVIEKHMAMVADPAQYRTVNLAHSLPRNRKKDVPYDEARQAFSSHHTRLGNLHKSRVTTEEKAAINARRGNFVTGAKLYEQMQLQAIRTT